MALLLGDDGRGYELARRLESCGAWRSWLGDAAYAAFAHSLSSPSAWESFMTPSPSGPRAQLQLQLRARALLFDKASAALFFTPSPACTAPQICNVNPSLTYLFPDLQLHEDDIYYSLEDEQQDGFQPQTPSRSAYSPHKSSQHSFERASSVGSRYNDPEHVNTSKYEDLPNKCYNQYIERYRIRHQKFPYGDRESHRRTSEGMSVYLRLCNLHKRKRQTFKEDTGISMHSRGLSEGNNSTDEDISFSPEILFPANCVPDSALPLTYVEKKQKVEVYGVLDNLPTVISPSPAMMERFGIRPEYVKMGNKYRGKDGPGGDKRPLSQEQVSLMANKASARLLTSVGFEGGTEVSMKVFSEFFGSHICKLGRMLKLLTDNYRKQFSSVELLKMFLQISGHGNLGALSEITKNSNKGGLTQQVQQTVRQLQQTQQDPLLQAQQLQRQMHPQMNILHPQNIAFQQQQQQQWDKLRRRQVSTPRGPMMIVDKDQPMAPVKIENVMEGPIDANTYNALSKQQMQLRQQQMTMAGHPTQAGQHFKQHQSIQIPQLQSQLAQNAFNMRTPPVKVEALHELMVGDSTLKQPDQSKLTSPPK